MGFAIYATPGTADVIRANGIDVQTVYRINDRQHPDALDLMKRTGFFHC